MADSSKTGDASAPQGSQTPPHLAESAPMEMSAPIEQIASTEPAAQLAPPPSPLLQAKAAPLSENVAPFNTPPSEKPAVEYVAADPAAMTPKPSVPPPRPRPVPLPKPRANNIPPPGRIPPTSPQAAPLPPTQQYVPPAVSMAPVQPRKRAGKIYSHNTRAVWRFHRTTRQIYTFIGAVLMILAAVLLMYWLSLGAPTKLEDIPLVRRILNL